VKHTSSFAIVSASTAAATKPSPAGTTTAPGSPAMPTSTWSRSEWPLPYLVV
jgi:hypothetical protein